MDEENILDFNFWPSFSDLMLSLVLILVLVLFVVSAILNVGTIDLSNVENNQDLVITEIEKEFKDKSKANDENAKEHEEVKKGLHVIKLSDNSKGDIFITNEPTMQKITFSSHILFPPDEIELNERGKWILRKVGKILKDNIDYIREIQIQGHADPTPTKYGSNMRLAALRAISVFNFLQEESRVDPVGHLMSVTSFGEYKPVQRIESGIYYDRTMLEEHNSKAEMKERNRRIELRLFYRYEKE